MSWRPDFKNLDCICEFETTDAQAELVSWVRKCNAHKDLEGEEGFKEIKRLKIEETLAKENLSKPDEEALREALYNIHGI